LGNLSTPKSVQKLQMALHAKAKAEAGYRFYALYDKISREDILAHAWAQCRSNRGAPGVDGQGSGAVDPDIEALEGTSSPVLAGRDPVSASLGAF
jgi:RNA-directed DNA polymerase